MSLSPQAHEIQALFQSGIRWIVWQHEDERACFAQLVEIAERLGRQLKRWSLDEETNAYLLFDQALDRMLAPDPPASAELWVWLDFAPPAPIAARLQRKLRRLAQACEGPVCLFLQFFAPSEPRPPERILLTQATGSQADLCVHIAQRCMEPDFGVASEIQDKIHAEREELARRCVGLERWQVDIALRMSALAKDDPESRIRAVEDYKQRVLQADRLIHPCQPRPANEMGGLERYKAWLRDQSRAMDPRAQALGVLAPRGALLVGIPGCGKSLAARVSADVLGLALYRIDLGRLFSGVLGSSEAKMRQTLALCERLAPAVIWIDEIEKGLAPSGSQSDGGTAQRSLATLMTWLQEHRAPIFLVATANRIASLPPELTRKGRLDEVFFVDLPNCSERRAILGIYGTNEWAGPPESQAQALQASEGYSGAELEVAVSQARLFAFQQERPPTWSDFLDALNNSVSLSKARQQEIEAMRNWGLRHARPASESL